MIQDNKALEFKRRLYVSKHFRPLVVANSCVGLTYCDGDTLAVIEFKVYWALAYMAASIAGIALGVQLAACDLLEAAVLCCIRRTSACLPD